MKRITTLVLTALLLLPASAQKDPLKNKLDDYFKNYRPLGQRIRSNAHLKSFEQNDSLLTILVTADNHFGEQTFTPQSVADIYKDVKALLPDSCRNYELTIKSGGWDLRQLIPNRLLREDDPTRVWGAIDYQGEPWVSNASLPYKITSGLQNRHLSIWASHGIYFHIKDSVWKWQRPALFGTREDLFTQTIVTPYLIPMLEKAGAVVFSPRERDWQKHEMIIDNDTRRTFMGVYVEIQGTQKWEKTDSAGFAYHSGVYVDNENPFKAGTARMAQTVEQRRNVSEISYQPDITEAGRYAVYVSYQTVPGSIDDAHYTVWHQGVATEFRVNQQMGGSTWVYLGTFDFDEGDQAGNRVVLNNLSAHKDGVVTADAVRFGGGMGNIRRGYSTSGMPRCLEGSRYYAQWAGMPYSVYSSKNGEDDYGDDINVRSLMTNYLAGGSCYIPDSIGRNVPLELSLAIHSDAGYTADGKSHTGTLAVCTTYLNDSILGSGCSRLASRDLADELLSTVPKEMMRKYGSWQMRELWDRNYSETRVPLVPSAILETMSHQNFADMKYGQDPNFRFDFARSIYKALLRYVARMHHTTYTVTPLAPNHLRVELSGNGEAMLSWNPVKDPDEPSAIPTGYVIYTAIGKGGFDNGQYVKASSVKIKLDPEKLYSFRVAAVNSGGESFVSEVVSTYYVPEAQKTVLIVNGFHRLASPAVRDNAAEQGFDLKYDAGVSYGRTAGWTGYQTCFNKATMGKTTSNGLGFSNDSLAGQFIAGNDFNYIRTHAEAIASAHRYNIASCSSEALENNEVRPTQYQMVDLILGLEKNDGWSLRRYHAFSPMMRQHLKLFTSRGGALLVSGSYVGADMSMPSERMYLESLLKCKYDGVDRDSLDRDTIVGMGTSFEFHRHLNDIHYAATQPDILQPMAPAFSAMKYADDYSACVAYDGTDYKAMTLGFPFECIKSEQKRHALMRGILKFLLQSL